MFVLGVVTNKNSIVKINQRKGASVTCKTKYVLDEKFQNFD